MASNHSPAAKYACSGFQACNAAEPQSSAATGNQTSAVRKAHWRRLALLPLALTRAIPAKTKEIPPRNKTDPITKPIGMTIKVRSGKVAL